MSCPGRSLRTWGRTGAIALAAGLAFATAGQPHAQTPGQSRPAQTAAQPGPQTATPAAPAVPPCRPVTHEEVAFTVCEVDLRRQAVRLFWQRPDGQAYGYLGSLPRSLPPVAIAAPSAAPSGATGVPSAKPPAPTGGRLQFAMNGGMFHPDYRPVGLYVEDGREITRANTRNGPGNFHLKPNGIFYTSGATAGVLETGAYLKSKPVADFATQSGPMLVINGRIHPRFSRDGESLKLRNGVGVRDASTIVLVISEGEVSFGTFARLFRDPLKCPNALFLDGGSAPALYAPALQRTGNFLPLGPMIGVFEKIR